MRLPQDARSDLSVIRNMRIPTARLNTWLGAMTEAHPPPAPGGRRIKLRYMTQVKTRPPDRKSVV